MMMMGMMRMMSEAGGVRGGDVGCLMHTHLLSLSSPFPPDIEMGK
jgi:hypothetical protein